MSRGQQFAVLLRALGADGRRRLLLLAVLTLLAGIAEFASLLALLQLLRSWLIPIGSGWSGAAAATFAITVIGAGAARFLLLNLTQKLAFDSGHRLLVAVQRRVLARDWIDHAAAKGAGPLAGIERVDQVVHGALLPLLQGGTAVVLGGAILAALIRIDAVAALTAAALLGLLLTAANRLFRPSLRRAGETIQQGYEARIETVQSNVGALRELILAGARGAAAERFRRIDMGLARARADIGIALGGPRIMVESVGLLALTGLAWWLSDRSGGLSAAVPSLGALALGAQRLLPLAQTVSNATASLNANRPIVQSLSVVLDSPDLADGSLATPLPFEHEIRLEQVSFTYPGRRKPAVDHVDLLIRRGERVALTGRNGSGKSTLADLVMGLLRPQEGQVLVDGRPLAATDLSAWQGSIAHVPQAPFLLDASIATNIAFMDAQPDHARVVEAARLTGLHTVIDALPRGYETRVGERALLLSGGQRQRLALARALYAPAKLLVLDEATSALDPEAEQDVLTALDALQQRGTTILLIAHRASMTERCDRVLRLENGRLAAS